MSKTELFVRRQPGGLFTVVNEAKATTGDIFWVDSGSATGSDAVGYGKNPDAPFLTLDYAIGQTAANNGDKIYVMAGHAESLAAAGAVAIDKAGISIIGLGEGADRPTFTFITSNNASMTLSAASVALKNILLIGNKDGLVAPLAITGSDFDVDVEYRDTSSAIEAKKAITVSGGAARGKIKLKHIGFTAGDNQTQAITVQNGANIDIDIDYYGEASTAVVDMVTTASTNINVTGYFYNDNVALTKNVVDTVTGSTWSVKGYDGKGGYSFTGGSAATPAADDVSTISSSLGASTDAAYTTATANTTASAMKYVKSHQNVLGLRNQAAFTTATANTTASVSQYVKSVQNVLGVRSQAAYTTATANTTASVSQYVKSVQNVIGIQGSSKNTAGVSSTVSVVSYVKELVDNTMGDINSARDKKLTVTADLTSATWATKTAHEIGVVSGQVRVRVLPIVTATAASNAAACLIKLGTSGQATAMLANTTAQFLTTGRIWNVTTAFQKTINYSGIFDKVVSGDDIGYSISGKTASAGTIVFHIWWEPLVTGSTVTAGTGGAF